MTHTRLRASPRSISVGAIKKKEKGREEKQPPAGGTAATGGALPPPPVAPVSPRPLGGAAAAARPRTARGRRSGHSERRRRAQRCGAAASPLLASPRPARQPAARPGEGGAEPPRSLPRPHRTCRLAAGAPRSLRAGNLGCSLKFWIMFLLSRSAGS